MGFCVTFPFLWASLKDFREQLVLAAGCVPKKSTSKERRTFGAIWGVWQWPCYYVWYMKGREHLRLVRQKPLSWGSAAPRLWRVWEVDKGTDGQRGFSWGIEILVWKKAEI